jgi:hypothetical protein
MIIIDTLTDGTVAYDQRTELDGEEYLLSFRWNERRARWAFSIAGLDGTGILTGQVVSLFVPLNRRAVGGPAGEFVAQPETDDHSPAGLLDLGARVKLVYLDAAAGDALAAGVAP